MAIFAVETSTTVETTALEITKLLVKKGARSILTDYGDDGSPIGVSFQLKTQQGLAGYKLPINAAGVHAHMQRENAAGRLPQRLVTRQQAARVAWRIALVWLKALIAVTESEALKTEDVLLPWLIVSGAGPDRLTLADAIQSGQLMLPAASESR